MVIIEQSIEKKNTIQVPLSREALGTGKQLLE